MDNTHPEAAEYLANFESLAKVGNRELMISRNFDMGHSDVGCAVMINHDSGEWKEQTIYLPWIDKRRPSTIERRMQKLDDFNCTPQRVLS